MKRKRLAHVVVAVVLGWVAASRAEDPPRDFSPRPEEGQLPLAMRSAMKEAPRITVGREKADLVGRDNRVLQAAVDYIAGLGGGTVEIGPGEYLMRDSLHVRSHVTVRGAGRETRLRKAPAAVSPLALDGDGVFFRNESLGMAAHRNRLEENVIEDNGAGGQAAGVRIQGQTNDLVFRNNVIRDTRAAGQQTQTVGVLIEEQAGDVRLEGNSIEAATPTEDRRKAK